MISCGYVGIAKRFMILLIKANARPLITALKKGYLHSRTYPFLEVPLYITAHLGDSF